MKTLFGMAALLAIVGIGVATIDSAEARGIRGGGAGNITRGNIQLGPRVTAPVIRPGRVPSQLPRRQIRGPRESGQGVNCYFNRTGSRQVGIINPRTGRSETVTVYSGNTRCRQRI
jgi:hypothetical protein